MKLGEFIEQFKLGDYSSFDQFYSLTNKQVYFTALSILKDKHLAEDITQETYVSFLNNIQQFDTKQNVYAYLTVIARNKSINVYNANKRVEFNDELLTNVSVGENLDVNGVEDILALLNDELSREIITYHVILGYKFHEISKIIKKPLGTVLWRYNKAMKELREKTGGIL